MNILEAAKLGDLDLIKQIKTNKWQIVNVDYWRVCERNFHGP